MRIRSSFSKLIYAIIFVFCGLYLTINLLYSLGKEVYVREKWFEYEATIYKIDHDSEERYISYSYHSKVYKVKSKGYSTSDNVGDLILIYINTEDPIEIFEGGNIFGNIVGSLFGIIFLTIGIIFLNKDIKFRKNYKLCIKEGTKKRVTIQSIRSTNFSVNRVVYYYLVVIYDGKEYKSNYFSLYKGFNLKSRKFVDFYYIDDDTYYIDLSSIEEKYIE